MAHIFENIFQLIETCLTVCVLLASHLVTLWVPDYKVLSSEWQMCLLSCLLSTVDGRAWNHWQGKYKVGRCQDKARMRTYILQSQEQLFHMKYCSSPFPAPSSVSFFFFFWFKERVSLCSTDYNKLYSIWALHSHSRTDPISQMLGLYLWCNVTKETQSHSKVSDPLALKIFLVPILQWSLSLKCGSVLLMCPLELGSAFWLVMVFL